MGKIVINLGQGGLGRKAETNEMISGLVMGSAVAASGLAIGVTSPKLQSLKDAEGLGLTAAMDSADDVLIHHHIKEFFRMNPDGSLYVRLVTQGTSLEDMCDKANTNVRSLIEDAQGDVFQVGVVLNPTAVYTPTLSGGLDQDVQAAITKAQALSDEQRGLKRPVVILIEGRSFNGTVASADDLRALECPDVLVTVAADNDISGSDTIFNGYAAVGTSLGAISKARVSENIGWTANFNIEDKLTASMINVGLSNNALASTLSEADIENLTEKGFIVARNYPGQTGAYFNDFPSCDLASSDYAFGENRRTINKAIILAYNALFPRINAPILIDPTTGKMDPSTGKAIEAEVKAELGVLVQESDASGVDANVDLDQDVQATGKVVVKIVIVAIATGRELQIELGFAKSI